MTSLWLFTALAACGAPPGVTVDTPASEWAPPEPDLDSGDPRPVPAELHAEADLLGTGFARAQTLTVYAVRHAEKESEGEDPGLTEAGTARAQALAERLHGVPIDAVYATELRRTQDTVRPTADAHHLPIVTDVDAEEELAAHLLAAHRGDTVLHAGHSYTLPELFDDLGFPELDVDGYGQLWILTVPLTGAPTAVETTFGEPDP